MIHFKENIAIYGSDELISVFYNAINECPICHTALNPVVLYEIVTSYYDSEQKKLTVLCLCPKCQETFITKYTLDSEEICLDSGECGFSAEFLSAAPFYETEYSFSKNLREISPKFIEIYNQSYQAEQHGLNEICGIGYRKSLEFLIKDFLITRNPESFESIARKPLVQCIADLSKDYPKLSTVAERAAWLGNDETHYARKHTSYDLETLKSFIEATVFYINLELVTDVAAAIERK